MTDEPLSLEAQVAEALRNAFRSLKRPQSKRNSDSVAIDALIYDYAVRFCKGASDQAWDNLTDAGLVPERDAIPQGDSVCYDGDVIAVVANLTKPVNRFDEDALADLLKKSKYKIPVMQTKDFVAKAKRPTKGRLTLTAVLK